MGWTPDHKRMRQTYSPILSAAEKRHEARVQTSLCFGCGTFGEGIEAHHLMLPFDGKRWRRDHRYRLPVCVACHRGQRGIHGFGREALWLSYVGKTLAEAIARVKELWCDSEAAERLAA